jgi:hypothetical protein
LGIACAGEANLNKKNVTYLNSDVVRKGQTEKRPNITSGHTLCHTLGCFLGNDALSGFCLSLGLDSHDAPTPLPTELIKSVIEVSLHTIQPTHHECHLEKVSYKTSGRTFECALERARDLNKEP